MMTAILMIIMVGGIGMAVDYATANNAKGRAQDIADAIALKAAAFVREYDRAPTGDDEDGLPAGTYTATELGYDNINAAIDVEFTLVYDLQSGEARVTVDGRSPTSFSKAMGFQERRFSDRSVATFIEKQVRDSASIVLVLDNSSSMGFDTEKAVYQGGQWQSPAGSQTRMTVLKNSVSAFMGDLRDLVGTGLDQRIIRTGLAGFTGPAVTPLRPMLWKTVTDEELALFTAPVNSGTQPSGALEMADQWLNGEIAIHEAITGRTPLKYVIFLSDGEVSESNVTWSAGTGTGVWRQEYRRRYEYWFFGWRANGWESGVNQVSSASKPDGPENTSYLDYINSYRRYRYEVENWVEGEFIGTETSETRAACDALKAQDVTVYAIGFALEPGKYITNNTPVYGTYRETSQETTDKAYALLQECASDEDTFIIAEDTVALENAFTTIGEDIMEEVIRVKS